MKYAIVESGVVVNVVVADAELAAEKGWVLADENTDIGGTYTAEDGFTLPPQPSADIVSNVGE